MVMQVLMEDIIDCNIPDNLLPIPIADELKSNRLGQSFF